MSKKYKWHKIADDQQEIAFASNNLAVVDVDGKKICIARFNENVYAVAYKCPHASGFMADGFIDALGNIVCPMHRYKFDLKNGRNTTGEGYYLNNWPVEIRDDGIYVGLEERRLFGLF